MSTGPFTACAGPRPRPPRPGSCQIVIAVFIGGNQSLPAEALGAGSLMPNGASRYSSESSAQSTSAVLSTTAPRSPVVAPEPRRRVSPDQTTTRRRPRRGALDRNPPPMRPNLGLAGEPMRTPNIPSRNVIEPGYRGARDQNESGRVARRLTGQRRRARRHAVGARALERACSCHRQLHDDEQLSPAR
jgi:hypothetical protein